MPRSTLIALLGLLGLVSLPSPAPAGIALAAEPYGVLVDEPGAEATYSHCAGCHSERLVAQQGLDRGRWDKLLVWMVEEQGMPEIPEPARGTILDYLVQNYGPARPNFPRPR